MTRICFATSIMILIMGVTFAFGQQYNLERLEDMALKDEKRLAVKNPRLSTAIAEYLESHQAALSPSTLNRREAFSRGLHIDGQGRLQVTIELHRLGNQVINAIKQVGGHVERINAARKRIQARLPMAQIDTFSKRPDVKFVRLPDYLIQHQGSEQTEGDAVIRADRARREFGVTGQGVKVGILSLGFEGWEDSVRTNDLPGRDRIALQAFRGDREIEVNDSDGTALMEIIYDVAPGVSFFGATVEAVDDNFDAIDWLVRQGCQIIATDLGAFNVGPYDGTSDIDQKITETIRSGISFFVPVGNEARQHYSGTFRDTDGDGFHEFPGRDEGISVTLRPNGTIRIDLQWDDPWGRANNDFDVFLDQWILGVPFRLGRGDDIQDGDDDPKERIIFRDISGRERQLTIPIVKVPGAQARRLHLFVTGDIEEPIEHNVPAGSIGNMACAKEALAIGAVHQRTPNVIEPYSSRGPTVDGRLKPDLVAPDGVSTTLKRDFHGTSASTPHAAAVAALILERRPDFAPSDIRQVLTSTAVDLGRNGPDNTFGHGRVDAYKAISTLAVGPIVLEAVQVDDDNINQSKGNGNGKAECGERIELLVTLRNRGKADAEGVKGVIRKLDTTDRDISITDVDVDYGRIRAGAIDVDRDYDFVVSENAAAHNAAFALRVTATNGGPWNLTFEIPIGECPSCPSSDVNEDGKVDILDLIMVALYFRQANPGNPRADVNSDGKVDIKDLILVDECWSKQAAPSWISSDGHAAMLQRWLINAHVANDGSEAFRRGIAVFEELLNSVIPEQTVLLSNYPNPFNPETWIPYQLAETVDVSLTIYSASGHQIRTLNFGIQAAGSYLTKTRAAYWDGRNQRGERIASGVYFYQLKAGDFTSTRRMVVVK